VLVLVLVLELLLALELELELLLVLVLVLVLPPREQQERQSVQEAHILSAARLPSPRYSSPFPLLSDRCLS